ncbi:class I SAM-dependent methyltransferase [Paenibacillus sp. CN-4]|uniref:tRNA (mnm(5)s(2)U34)-methyltransferase n=1 Tax=Paenibacillus nanchangensis TaxID=3348343 RepID=UPI003979A9C1
MGFLSVLSFAHKLVGERLASGGFAVDATVGTGADTLFLASAAGPRGAVAGFDIQPEALELARERMLRASETQGAAYAPVSWLLQGHENMLAALPAEWRGAVSAVMFNLGYLPGERTDKTVITRTDTTLAALDGALALLRPGGIITAVLYPGHEGGREEAEAVEHWAASLPPAAGQSVVYRQLQRPAAPYLVAVEKRG